MSHNWLLTKYECNVPWYDPTWDVVICYSITNTIIKWYNTHLILIILAHPVIERNITHNFMSWCFLRSYFHLMLTTNHFHAKRNKTENIMPSCFVRVISLQWGEKNIFLQSSYKITYIQFSQSSIWYTEISTLTLPSFTLSTFHFYKILVKLN